MSRLHLHIIMLALALALCPFSASGKGTAASARMEAISTDSLFRLGEAAYDRDDLDEALAAFTALCSRDDGSSARRLFSLAHQHRGHILYQRERHAEAMQEYLRARGIAEKEGLADRLPSIYINIGNVFSETDDIDTGIMFYRKALSAVADGEAHRYLPVAYNNLFYAYYLKENADSSKKYFNLYRDLRISDGRSRYDLLLNRGLLDEMEGHHAEAIAMFRLAAAFARDSLASPLCAASANSYIAHAYEHTGSLDSALVYLHGNVETARANDYNNLLVESLRDLARIYDRLGRSEEALQYKSDCLALSDSLFSRETLNLIKNSQADYERNADAYTIRTLNMANALQRGWIIALFAVIAVIALLSGLLWRQKRRLSAAWRGLYERNLSLLDAERRYTGRIAALEKRLEETEAARPEATALAAPAPQAEATAPGASAGVAPDAPSTRRLLISKEQREKLLDRIIHVMEEPTLYCDPDFSIDRLAAAIESNSRYVSEVINEEYGMNFRAFLNRYRVKEAMRRLEDIEHYGHLTIKAVAESVGYKSQATFITVFTKETGLKPSLYQHLARTRHTT